MTAKTNPPRPYLIKPALVMFKTFEYVRKILWHLPKALKKLIS
ncbi:hypothetical protein ENHYDAX1_80013 [Enhydrobacter sp. AX1]|nr:hypothetical protein ENHYDAX1_80013 [Enhydrobacter sp. AX1]